MVKPLMTSILQRSPRAPTFALFALLALFSTPVLAATFNVTSGIGTPDSGFAITNYQQTPDRIYPGDQVRLQFLVGTTQLATASNVRLSVLTPFVATANEFGLGDIQPGSPAPVTVDFTVPDTTKPGSYYVFAYAAAHGTPQTQVAEIPLTINEPVLSNALMARIGTFPAAYAGESVEVPIKITNVGSLPAQDVVIRVVFGSGNALTPLSTDRAYIASIDANQTVNTTFSIGVNAQASAGFYPLTLLLYYNVDKVAQPTVNQTFGLQTLSKTGLLLTLDRPTVSNGTTTMLVTVANVGDTAVRGVYVTASSNDYSFSTTPEKFVGTLNLDDSATLSLTATPKNGAAGTLHVTVTYKDALNIEHTQNQDFTADSTTAAASNLPNGAAKGQRFGNRNGNSSLPFGLSLLEIILGVALLIAAYLAYKWHQKRKTTKNKTHLPTPTQPKP